MTRPDPILRRLVVAAVRLADVIEVPESAATTTDEYNRRFMAADEELREASLAYARGLGESDRRRLGA